MRSILLKREKTMSEQYNMTRRTLLASSAFVGALAPMLTATPTLAENVAANAKASPVDISKLPREKIELVKPPFVHKHTQKAQGGPKVIEAINDSLALQPDALELTWRSLAEIGNVSSASVLHILRDTMHKRPADGSPAVMMAMGPGFCSELVLLQWS